MHRYTDRDDRYCLVRIQSGIKEVLSFEEGCEIWNRESRSQRGKAQASISAVYYVFAVINQNKNPWVFIFVAVLYMH